MKYIIIPILKTIGLLFIVLYAYPVAYCFSLIACAWCGNWKPIITLHHLPFSSSSAHFSPGNPVFYYRTVWHWYIGRKTYMFDLETGGF